MKILVVGLVIVGILALGINAGFGSVIGLTPDQLGRVLPLLLILMLLGSALVGRRQQLGAIISGFAIWIGIGAVLIVGYSYRHELGIIGQRIMGELQPGAAIVSMDGETVRVNRTFGGSFRVNAGINGTEVPMIFDTGASAVVLTGPDARSAGIDTARLNYDVAVQTANGIAQAAAVTLDVMNVGPIARDRIRAFVLPDEALEISLLGMSFLDTLSRFSVTQDALELED